MRQTIYNYSKVFSLVWVLRCEVNDQLPSRNPFVSTIDVHHDSKVSRNYFYIFNALTKN